MKKMVNGIEVEVSKEEALQLQTEWDLNLKNPTAYILERRLAYPDISNQLDAIIKQFEMWRTEGYELSSEMNVIVDQCLLVKEIYPKPEANE